MNKKKITVGAFVLMILTSVFGVTNIGIGFYRMGYAAIPMFVIGGLLFFVPFIMMATEFATGFNKKSGGIFTWMKESVNLKYAFIGIMMWYSSYVIWMLSKSLSIWVPLSFAIFGEDVTINPVMFGNVDIGPFILGIVGIILMLVIFKIVSSGASKLTKVTAVGGLSVIALNFILIIGGLIAFVLNGFELQTPLTASSLVTSPNSDYQSIIPFLGFVVFAVFAYGGTEAMAGIADDLENPQKDVKKGLFLAGIFIIVCYIFGFLMVGASLSWSDFPAEVTSMSALFIIMQNLGDTIAGPGSMLGQFLMRFSAIGMFLSYLGAMIALAYAPLKQLIEGTPKEFWPSSFEKVNKNGVRVNALKVQTLIVIIFIAVKSILSLINPEGAAALYELLITMTNVGMTIPYIFIIYAWYKFRENDQLPKNIILIKSQFMIKFCLISTMSLVFFGNIFTIISPFLVGDYSSGIWTIIGPVVFSILALLIYSNAKDKLPK